MVVNSPPVVPVPVMVVTRGPTPRVVVTAAPAELVPVVTTTAEVPTLWVWVTGAAAPPVDPVAAGRELASRPTSEVQLSLLTGADGVSELDDGGMVGLATDSSCAVADPVLEVDVLAQTGDVCLGAAQRTRFGQHVGDAQLLRRGLAAACHSPVGALTPHAGSELMSPMPCPTATPATRAAITVKDLIWNVPFDRERASGQVRMGRGDEAATEQSWR